MTETNNIENIEFHKTHRTNSDSECELHILTQEAVDEHYKNYPAPLTKQLEQLTLLIHGMSRANEVNAPPTPSTNARSSTAGMPLDSMLQYVN